MGWLFDRVCGIVVKNGGITIQPYPNRRLGHAEAVYRSPLGEIRSAWRYEGDSLQMEMDISTNSVAAIILPDGRKSEATPGSYSFTIKT